MAAVVAGLATTPGAAAAHAGAPASPGSLGLRLVDVPTAARDDPRAQLYIVDHLASASVIHRRIEVSNTTASTAHVVLYAAAATISGGSFLGAAGRTPNELSTWTSVRPGEYDVPAGAHATSTVTIAVPGDSASGERYAVVWAEVRSGPVAGDGLALVSRVGIRLYVLVGPAGPPAADFAIESLTAQRSPDGRAVVLATVRNTGGRALDLTGTLRLLDGPGRLTAGPFPAALGTTLGIGETEPVTVALDGRLPAGPWDARITLHSGLLERSARATIVFPAAGSAPPVAATATRRGWPYPAVAGILLLLGVTMLILRLMRSRRHRATDDPAPADPPAPSPSH